MLEMSNADAEFLYSVRLLSGVLVGLGVLIIGEIPYSLFFHKKIDVNNEAVTSMSDVKTETTYFESGGRHNTKSALKLVRERALKQNIRNIVIASIRGQSVDIALEIFCGTDIDLTIVGCDGCDACPPFSKSAKQRAEDAEHRVIFAPEGSIPYPAEAQFAFRRICEGMKVCVHLAMAVAEQELVPSGQEIHIATNHRGSRHCTVAFENLLQSIIQIKGYQIWNEGVF